VPAFKMVFLNTTSLEEIEASCGLVVSLAAAPWYPIRMWELYVCLVF
jgi:hypothetical protein